MQSGAAFIVAEGAESVKGATSIPIGKAMDDCLIAYGQNGEALRPQQGFPIRLLVPGFEGMHNVKYLRRIKVVEKDYMTYNDYGHIVHGCPGRRPHAHYRAEIDHHISFRGAKVAGARVSTKSRDWHGRARLPFAMWKSRPTAGRAWKLAELRTPSYPMAHTRFAFPWTWDGKECVIMSRCTDELGTRQPTRAESAKYLQ